MELTTKQLAFRDQYVIDFDGTKSAIRAGYSEKTAGQIAFQLLQNPNVMKAIQEKMAEIAARAELSAEWVLRQWKQIAEADPNDLISVRIECCHHCYGENYEYQWTELDYGQALRAAAAHRCEPKCDEPCMKRIPPPNAGGFGYDFRREPNSTCPVCHGDGIEKVRLADTKRIKGSARRLFAGVKQTRDGIEVKMRDQDAALGNIAKYLGMLIDKRELSGPGGGPIATVNYTAQDLSDDQLATIINAQAEFIDDTPAPALLLEA